MRDSAYTGQKTAVHRSTKQESAHARGSHMTESDTKRHFIIPDTQVRPDSRTDHLLWVAQAIVDYKPTTVVHLGDHWDLPSLSAWDKPGSAKMEGARYRKDIDSGNEAFEMLSAPMLKEVKRQSRKVNNKWNPARHFLRGNHCWRIDRALSAEPKLIGTMSPKDCITTGWKVHEFLEKVELDGITYSHFFQANNSPAAIGGSTDNMLNKIGVTHTMGHRQGFQYGCRVYPGGMIRHGLVAGSCYTQREEYRGNQGQKHWRGVVVKNEVRNGDYSIMPLTLDYLCRKYEGRSLFDFMSKKYKHEDWRHLK